MTMSSEALMQKKKKKEEHTELILNFKLVILFEEKSLPH